LILSTGDPVWYVAYGSNLSEERFRCYLEGGRPTGSRRTYEGCRDRSGPVAREEIRIPGALTFAGTSTVWGGAMAFYDPAVPGEVAARAYLVTFGQFSDVVAQEARRPTGHDLSLGRGRAGRHPAPSRVYESVLHLGERRGIAMLTLTSVERLDPAPPAAPYLRVMLSGLAQGFGLTDTERVAYLLRARGVGPTWTDASLSGLLAP